MSSFSEKAELAKKIYFEKLAEEERSAFPSADKIVVRICEYIENQILQNIQNGCVVKRKELVGRIFNKSMEATYTFASVEIHFNYKPRFSVNYIPPEENDNSSFFIIGVSNMQEARTLLSVIMERLEQEKILLKGKEAFWEKLNSLKSVGNVYLQFVYDLD